MPVQCAWLLHLHVQPADMVTFGITDQSLLLDFVLQLPGAKMQHDRV